MGRPFGTWLDVTRRLQCDAYGADPHALEGPAYGAFLGWNVTAIVAELGELLAETPAWKTWVVTRSRDDDATRDRMVGEVIDVLHFVANMLVLLRCDDEELSRRYLIKVERNRARQASGAYDGKTSKCPNCARALDDVGTSVRYAVRGTRSTAVRICKACDHVLERDA